MRVVKELLNVVGWVLASPVILAGFLGHFIAASFQVGVVMYATVWERVTSE